MTGHVINEHITINASPDTVWDVVTDLSGRADYLRSTRKVELLTDGEYGVSTTWREDRDLFGHHGTEELHVTQCEGHHTVQETRLRHDRVTTAWQVGPSPEGGAKLMITVTADMSERNPLEKLAWGLWGELNFQGTRRHLRHDLEDIRAEAERRAGDADGAGGEGGAGAHRGIA